MALALERAAEIGKDGIDPEGDYEVDEKQRSYLTDEGFAKTEQIWGAGLFGQDPWAHYITNALKAKAVCEDVNYIVRDGEAVIVDEFTGRVMPERRWVTDSTGDRSKGSPSDSGGNSDPRLDHLPELLPALSPSGGHDRYPKPKKWNLRRPTN